MGFADRVIARAAPEQRAITEWGSSAIPGPLGNMAMGGGSYASVDLRRSEAALQKVAIWSSIDLIAGVASQLPLQTFRLGPDSTGKPIGNSKFVEDPGGEDQGCGDWVYQYLGSKLMRGNAYGQRASYDQSTGYPTQIVLYHPDDVKGSRDRYTGVATWRVYGQDVPAAQMWHRRAYPVAGQLLGLSPIGQHATTIGQGISAARFGQQFFTDGGHPTVVLQNSEEEIDQTKATVVKTRLMSTIWGSREPVVMGRGWDFKTLSVSPEESQFLQTQQFTGAECCRIFGPNIAEILGYETGGSMTYANQEQRAIDFLKFTLNRWLRDVEAVFTRYLPGPQYVRFDRKVLLETDLISRYQAHKTARDIGLSNIDELRGMEDLSPLPNGQGADYTPLLIQVAASRGIDAAQVHAGKPPADQPSGQRSAAPDPKDGEARKFNPAEPRDPLTGRWLQLGAEVAHEVHQLEGGELHITAHPNQYRHVTLRHGDRSVTLTPHEHADFQRHLSRRYSDEGGVSHTNFGTRHHRGENGKPRTEVLYQVTHSGYDEEGAATHHTLTIAPNESDTTPGLGMTGRQASEVGGGAHAVSRAARVETGMGLLDMFATKDGHIGFRMKDDTGNPTEVTFGERDWGRLHYALWTVVDGFHPDDEDNNTDLPDINHVTVKTAAGPVNIDWHGPHPINPAAMVAITPGYDASWSVVVDGDHMRDVFADKLGHLDDAAGFDQIQPTPADRAKWMTVHKGDERRRFDPAEPRRPDGKWGSGGGVVGKLGRTTMDDFFAAHGGDDAWHDQYGGNDGPSLILWHSGQASLYYPTGKGGSHAFVLSGIDSHSSRQFADAVDWAAKHPIDKPEHLPDGPAGETRTVKLPDTEVHVGYGYDRNEDGTSDLYVTATFPNGATGGKDKTFTMYEAGDQNASALADDLRMIAHDIDSKAYEGA